MSGICSYFCNWGRTYQNEEFRTGTVEQTEADPYLSDHAGFATPDQIAEASDQTERLQTIAREYLRTNVEKSMVEDVMVSQLSLPSKILRNKTFRNILKAAMSFGILSRLNVPPYLQVIGFIATPILLKYINRDIKAVSDAYEKEKHDIAFRNKTLVEALNQR